MIYDASLGTDPTAQGWAKSGSNQVETVSGGTFTFGNSYNPAGILYTYTDGASDFRDGFSVTMNDFRIVSETTTSYPNNGNFIFGANRYQTAGVPHYWLNSDRIWLGIGQNYSTAYLFDTTGTAHDYTINYLSDGSFDFLIDGAVISALSGTTTITQAFNQITVGDDTFAVSGVYEFSSIQLSGAAEASVPAPAGIGLMALGLIGIGRCRFSQNTQDPVS